ncbi:hypothetical protein BCV70DRAFT_99126 [Testicularia cyperi]|uniref:Uncharacterized protein n=1 Tax=Testicularia cyperi TaxID=1882483 RepID=A0A317XTJ8_9BASI|nr:hypothetical protein BCV70DRAFT_99126 [Testicularia cyperi]
MGHCLPFLLRLIQGPAVPNERLYSPSGAHASTVRSAVLDLEAARELPEHCRHRPSVSPLALPALSVSLPLKPPFSLRFLYCCCVHAWSCRMSLPAPCLSCCCAQASLPCNIDVHMLVLTPTMCLFENVDASTPLATPV